MSDYRNRDFQAYDAMSTEELEEILRLDAEAPAQQESDTELLLYVMGVLAERRKITDNAGKTAQESWESFQQNYLPHQEASLPDMPARKTGWAAAPWLRRVIAAAAVIVLVVCIPLTASAFGWDEIWQVFARWAKETFSFVSSEDAELIPPSPVDEGNYTSLQDALEDNNRDPDIVPTWIPEGFVLDKIEIDITPEQEIYRAGYVNKDKRLKIRVHSYLSGDADKVEIDEEVLEIYDINGRTYYIFSNKNQTRVVWIQDSYQCNISGDISVEELKLMIDSIGKG